MEERGWDTAWGAAVGWNLFEPGPGQPTAAPGTDVVGIRFTLTLGEGHVADLRLSVTTAEGEYCAPVDPGTSTVYLRDLKRACWKPGGAGWTARSPFPAVKWQVVSEQARARRFTFCVTNLATLAR